MKTPTPDELSTLFTPDEWKGRPPAYASGGPLHIPADAPRTLTEALLRRATQEDRGIIYVQKPGAEDFQSYGALLREARQVLGGLRRLGLAPGSPVVLQIESLRLHFTTFWACVLGGYTPVTVAVAPSYAEKNGVVSKLFNTWKLLEAPLIITSSHLQEAIAGISRFLPMENLKTVAVETLLRGGSADEIYESKPEGLVFFQLTSGSTGIPKCIQETHQGIICHIHGAQQFNSYSAQDVTLNWLPVDHVVPILTSHLKDVYLGCQQIHVKSDVILADPLRWLDLMEKHRVTHTWCPNFGFKLVSDRLAEAPGRKWDLRSIQFMMNAGEQVTLPVVRGFLDRTAPFGIRPRAMQPAFGMAEVCTCMTYQNQFDVEQGVHRFRKSSLGRILESASPDDPAAITFVDLGPPVPGVEIRITDKENKVVPEGVIGRFQIRGQVVTPGYLYNDAANHEAFVGNGWFNSGDLGFILNGRLTLTGREKEMIIVRGANFYCYEIEDVVNGIEGVEPTFASSSAVADPATGTEGLAIFFVPKLDFASPEAATSLCKKIRMKVAASLGINPSVVVPLENKQFLKTTSGKIQRSQMKKNFEAGEYAEIIQKLESVTCQKEGANAQGALEEKLLVIWKELLRVKQMSTGDNFFALGGDSLLAARVVARVQDAFNVELPLQVLFNGGGTIAGMAEHIRAGGKKVPALPPISKSATRGPSPLSAQQKRLWLVDQIHPGCPAYNVGVLIRLEGDLDLAALKAALDALAARHEALRTSYRVVDGKPVQVVAEPIPVELQRKNLSGPSDQEIREAALSDATQPFDLASGKLFRTALYSRGEKESFLLLVIHQIATDSWSMGILFKELKDYYSYYARGTALKLKPIEIRVRDFAEWQSGWLTEDFIEKEMVYWRKELAVPLPVLEVETDFPHPPAQTFEVKAERISLPAEMTEKIRAFARENNSTVFMVLLSAWQALLCRLSNQEEVVVGTAMSARSKPELEPVVGFFVNTAAVRGSLSSNPTFSSFTTDIRRKILSGFEHQHAPFERLVQELQPTRDRSRPPIFQSWFGSWDPLPTFDTGSLRFEVKELFTAGAQFELSLFVMDAPEEISIVWEFNPSLFTEKTIGRIRRQYEALLNLALSEPGRPLQTIFGRLSEMELEWQLQEQAQWQRNLRVTKRRTIQVGA